MEFLSGVRATLFKGTAIDKMTHKFDTIGPGQSYTITKNQVLYLLLDIVDASGQYAWSVDWV
jgi:hypothetical protein